MHQATGRGIAETLDVTGLSGRDASTLALLLKTWNPNINQFYHRRDGKRHLIPHDLTVDLDHPTVKALHIDQDILASSEPEIDTVHLTDLIDEVNWEAAFNTKYQDQEGPGMSYDPSSILTGIRKMRDDTESKRRVAIGTIGKILFNRPEGVTAQQVVSDVINLADDGEQLPGLSKGNLNKWEAIYNTFIYVSGISLDALVQVSTEQLYEATLDTSFDGTTLQQFEGIRDGGYNPRRARRARPKSQPKDETRRYVNDDEWAALQMLHKVNEDGKTLVDLLGDMIAAWAPTINS